MRNNLIFLLIGIVLLVFTFQTPNFSNTTSTRYPPPEGLQYYLFGFNNIASDLLWIRLLQDSGECEQKGVEEVKVIDKLEAEDILKAKVSPSKCHLGWYYKMLDSITTLTPKFEIAYRVGGTILSILTDDREGARRIFEKGIKQFPNDWVIAFRAAYHYLYEFQDAQRAADLLLQANQNGGPPWLPVLAARLYTTTGRAALGISVLEEYLKTNPEYRARERAIKRLEILKKQLQQASQ